MARALRRRALRLDRRRHQRRRPSILMAVSCAAILCSPITFAEETGQSSDPNAGAAQWLGLAPNGTNALALVYVVVFEHSRLTGRLGASDVDLVNADGVWTGRLGRQEISDARVASSESDRTTVEVNSVGSPGSTQIGQQTTDLGGRRRFVITTNDDGVVEMRMTGGASEINGAVRLSADGTRLRLSTQDELTHEDGPIYRGRNRPGFNVAQQLEVYGSLVPSVVSRSDPVLYALLYYFALELEVYFPGFTLDPPSFRP